MARMEAEDVAWRMKWIQKLVAQVAKIDIAMEVDLPPPQC